MLFQKLWIEYLRFFLSQAVLFFFLNKIPVLDFNNNIILLYSNACYNQLH